MQVHLFLARKIDLNCNHTCSEACLLFTCIALAKAGLVLCPLRPSVLLSVRPSATHLWFLVQGGQSRDTHVVISHILFTFCARLKVCLTIIFLVYGGVQK